MKKRNIKYGERVWKKRNCDMTSLIMILGGIGFLLFCGSRSKKEWLLNVVMRCILGTIQIYFVNVFLASLDISVGVGINSFTVLTCAILGFPGVVGLYCIGIYQML